MIKFQKKYDANHIKITSIITIINVLKKRRTRKGTSNTNEAKQKQQQKNQTKSYPLKKRKVHTTQIRYQNNKQT